MGPTTFDEIFGIMKSSFPVNEIRTYSGQRSLLHNPNYRLFTEQDAKGRTLAFLAAWEFPALRFVEHIAVDPGIRGGGLGKKLMLNYIGRSDIPILLEVEPPSGELEQRRIGFYERLGFHLNAYEYNQPPLRTGQADLPLRIMTYPRPINREEFHQYREILYTEVYKVTTPDSRPY
ncbi:GNAT family acetyltraansferase [Paenibacillus sp. FSL H7-0357]|uniref:GNAT family N-acetyltransferase n=1 Tax=Paenibacillus sp. FSL H7-0357 TaxID=1536774 RepID=UPI0004F5B3C1|nr:GNAT family N-acetyltransferase [Paenibacillus sp. FSL H7-0357]AIQ15986.1 GNAT family acetyltraansferase [Paenibacillus sp. FSL H7-0357]